MNYTEQLNKIMTTGNFRGVLIERLVGGYRLFGQTVKTEKEVNDLIDGKIKVIEKSIVNPKDATHR